MKDELSDHSPALVDAATSDDPTAEEVLRLLLTDRRVQNMIVHAITQNSTDVKAMIKAQAAAALSAEHVLTTGNYGAQLRGPFDDWLRDRVYEALGDAVRDGWLAGSTKPPSPKAH